jgi:hypothetical protein
MISAASSFLFSLSFALALSHEMVERPMLGDESNPIFENFGERVGRYL